MWLAKKKKKGGPMAIDEADIDKLRETLTGELKKHSPTQDSWYYNGGTVLALLATSAATISRPPTVSG